MHRTTVALDDVLATDHALEFIERQMFYEYDAAYHALTVEDLPYEQEVRAYEGALNAISHIRNELTATRTNSMSSAAEAVDNAL